MAGQFFAEGDRLSVCCKDQVCPQTRLEYIGFDGGWFDTTLGPKSTAIARVNPAIAALLVTFSG